MALPWIAQLTVERLRAIETTDDGHGNESPNWDSAIPFVIENCWIGRPGGREISSGQQTTLLEQWWWGPENADVKPTDRIRDMETGIVYEVDGPVILERDPLDLYSHKTCQLKAVQSG